MQAVLNTTQHPDLYRFLAALAEVSYDHLSEPKLADKTHHNNSVVVWSPESKSDLLDCADKLEVVERHARRLGVQIILSAASNPALRSWGHQVGWTVLWEVPGLDRASQTLVNFEADDAELDEEIAS